MPPSPSGLPPIELAALVAKAREGDHQAFAVLVEHYYRMVSILAYQKVRHRTDAEDLVQESFVRAYRALDSLREPEKFGGWLYHIALKICLDHLRKRERHETPLRLDEVPHTGSSPESPGIAILEQREEQTKISDAIASLPEKYRVVVTLRFVEKKSYREIAQMLGEPDGTIANRIHRAIKMLQGALKGIVVQASDVSSVEEAEA